MKYLMPIIAFSASFALVYTQTAIPIRSSRNDDDKDNQNTLVRRADLSRPSVFAKEKSQYNHIYDRIQEVFQHLLTFIDHEHVNFTDFRTLSEILEAEVFELSMLSREISYNRQTLKDRLELLQVLITTLHEGCTYDSMCDAYGEWIDCSLADLFELRLSFTNLFDEFGPSKSSPADLTDRLSTAKADLARIEKSAKSQHSQFLNKWTILEEACEVSALFLQSVEVKNDGGAGPDDDSSSSEES